MPFTVIWVEFAVKGAGQAYDQQPFFFYIEAELSPTPTLSCFMYLRFQIPLSLIKEQVKLTLQELRSGTKGAVKLLPAPEWDLHGEENKLVCQVPVEVHARADWLELARTVLLGGSLPPLIRFRIKVIVKIQLLILGNWELKARPVVSYSWVEEPALSLGFKLPLRELVEPLLDREMQKLADNLTHWIPATVQLFDNMTQAWRETQEPRIIDSPLWLRILSKDKAIAIITLCFCPPDN